MWSYFILTTTGSQFLPLTHIHGNRPKRFDMLDFCTPGATSTCRNIWFHEVLTIAQRKDRSAIYLQATRFKAENEGNAAAKPSSSCQYANDPMNYSLILPVSDKTRCFCGFWDISGLQREQSPDYFHYSSKN